MAEPADKPTAPQAPTQPHIEVDDSQTVSSYTNFCRVTGTPEELIVDFGLNPQATSAPSHPIRINQRLVMNYFTAKRLLGALRMSLDRHEAAFGVVETNVQMRVQSHK